MAYIELSDLSQAMTDKDLIQLTDDAGTGLINTVRVDEVIEMADSVVNSYIAGRYKVPLAGPIPEVVRAVSVSIAVYFLWMRSDGEIPDKRKEAYSAAITLLKDIARGTATLGIEETTQERENAAANKPANDRIFTVDSMKGF